MKRPAVIAPRLRGFANSDRSVNVLLPRSPPFCSISQQGKECVGYSSLADIRQANPSNVLGRVSRDRTMLRAASLRCCELYRISGAARRGISVEGTLSMAARGLVRDRFCLGLLDVWLPSDNYSWNCFSRRLAGPYPVIIDTRRTIDPDRMADERAKSYTNASARAFRGINVYCAARHYIDTRIFRVYSALDL